MKPENAINVPEKYRKLPSQSKPTTETTEVREEESYDIDPRQAGVEDVDLSQVNVSNVDISINIDDNLSSSSLPLINKTQRCRRTGPRSGKFSKEKRKCREI